METLSNKDAVDSKVDAVSSTGKNDDGHEFNENDYLPWREGVK